MTIWWCMVERESPRVALPSCCTSWLRCTSVQGHDFRQCPIHLRVSSCASHPSASPVRVRGWHEYSSSSATNRLDPKLQDLVCAYERALAGHCPMYGEEMTFWP